MDMKPRPTGRIVGGNDTEIGEFKYMVSIRTGDDRNLCGGTILDATHILTACHCCLGDLPKVVIVGRYHVDHAGEGESHDVLKIICHENFDESVTGNDICVLKVSLA